MDICWSAHRKDIQQAEAIVYHHNYGQYLRNALGLWHNSPLAQHFKEVIGIQHPDDMSHYLLERYIAWLRSAEHRRPWEPEYIPPSLPL